MCRSQWPRDLRRRSTAVPLLRLWVRISPAAWMFFCYECCVWSGRGLCDRLITGPEESYRLWCVGVWSWSLDNKWGPDPLGAVAPWKCFINEKQISSETSILWDHKQQRWLVTGVSEQTVLPILKGQVVQEDGLLGHCIETTLNINICCVIPRKSERSHSHGGGNMKSLILDICRKFYANEFSLIKKESPSPVFVLQSISFKFFRFSKFVFA